MKFLCLVHVDVAALNALNPADWADFVRDNRKYGKWLVESGHSIASSALEDRRSATLVRSRAGSISMTDGPYVETREQLGAFMFIEARNRQEALAIVARSPAARVGTIEVLPARSIELA